MPGAILPISATIGEPVRLAGETHNNGAFQETLSAAIRSVENSGRSASAAVERLLTGEGEELHTALMAAQRAELAFELFLQVRNKVVSAYQEIMRMQM